MECKHSNGNNNTDQNTMMTIITIIKKDSEQ